jgi:hypothetical protein
VVRGAVITLYANGVEIGKHTLAVLFLTSSPFRITGLGHGNIHFRNIFIEATAPKAFIVRQFTPEYEALFRDVIEPACSSAGLQPYRADFTFMPALVIEDIKKQIQEARLVIAEITPQNANVYYEVGYADALGRMLCDRR